MTKDNGVPPSGSGCQPTASAADASSRSGIPNALDLIAADREALLTALYDAKLQLEYLDGRCPTGTTPATLARVKHALSEALPWEVFAQAIEARQGGDGTAPSQDESAVRQDAPGDGQ